jgi:plastocyanin
MNRVVCLLALVAAASLGSATSEISGDARLGDKPVADAVVWLDAPNAPRSAAPVTATLDQRDMTFLPRVLAVRTGTTVTFPNNDRVFHDVFSDHEGKTSSLGTYPVGTEQRIRFTQAGLSRIFCHIHPQMAAYIVVVDSPYFAVADAGGRFTLPSVPVGEYRYHAWRPGGPTLDNTITVAGASMRLEVRWP